MKRREFITLFGGAAAWPIVARGQERKFARIGALVLTSADAQSLAKALREGLREFGYAEGQILPSKSVRPTGILIDCLSWPASWHGCRSM